MLAKGPHDELPRLSPPIGVDGVLSHWRLRPFQAPNDWRLTDGSLYRVLWVGASGEIVPPANERTIPGLLFHLDRCGVDEAQADTQVTMTLSENPEAAQVQPVVPLPIETGSAPATETRVSEPTQPARVAQESPEDDVRDKQATPAETEIINQPIEILKLAVELEGLAEALRSACLAHKKWRDTERSKQRFRQAMEAGIVDQSFGLARRLCDGFCQRPIQFLVLSAHCSGLLANWLGDLIRALCDQHHGKEALDLYERLRAALGDAATERIAPRLGVLLQAAQREEAFLYAQQCMQSEHADEGTLELCIHVFQESGNLVMAERAARRQYQRALDSFDPLDLKLAADSLRLVLSLKGNAEEVRRLDEMFGENGTLEPPSQQQVRPSLAEPDELPLAEHVETQTSQPTIQPPRNQPYVAPPKIGRNKPCPCGSGEKYKKCCGKEVQS